MKEYIENNFTLGEILILHEWYWDRSKHVVQANALIDQLEKSCTFTHDKFIETIDCMLIEKLLWKIEGIKSLCDF